MIAFKDVIDPTITEPDTSKKTEAQTITCTDKNLKDCGYDGDAFVKAYKQAPTAEVA
jgi:hypothetical protein